ncbi:MAG: ferrous iron transport protein A [Myxococcaceae bacterium]|nr:ferrous iron transport protein A [Myxococcaceae bacterium]MBH2005888.1 ferrous iron transport protein A [Myxococcaceae bacterium]
MGNTFNIPLDCVFENVLLADDSMKLWALAMNQPATIRSVDCRSDSIRRLQELGFFPGASVCLIRKGLLGSPLLFEICETQIAIRRSEADCFEVEYPSKD